MTRETIEAKATRYLAEGRLAALEPMAQPDGPNPARARLLTAGDLAERWQVTEHHVYRLAREGRLPVVELGRYKRFRLVEIEAFEINGGTQRSEKPFQSAVQSGTGRIGRGRGRR